MSISCLGFCLFNLFTFFRYYRGLLSFLFGIIDTIISCWYSRLGWLLIFFSLRHPNHLLLLLGWRCIVAILVLLRAIPSWGQTVPWQHWCSTRGWELDREHISESFVPLGLIQTLKFDRWLTPWDRYTYPVLAVQVSRTPEHSWLQSFDQVGEKRRTQLTPLYLFLKERLIA